MKYPLILSHRQTVEYNVLHAMESDKYQAHHVRKYLLRLGIEYSARQVSGAIQRLRKSGLIVREHGLWILSKKPK